VRVAGGQGAAHRVRRGFAAVAGFPRQRGIRPPGGGFAVAAGVIYNPVP